MPQPGSGVERAARIGVFGGTFDPVHVGHLVAAVNARAALGLDTVLLVVANVPWQKVGERAVSDAADRLAMVASHSDDAVVSEKVRGVQHVDVKSVALDPLPAVKQAS